MFASCGVIVEMISNDDPFSSVTIRPARGELGLQGHRIGAAEGSSNR
jgi:hypothetical protein